MEAIDPVRFLSNRSSGKQGYAIASALAAFGAKVTLVSGPTALNDPANVSTVRVESAREMLEACQSALPADVFIGVAAVADWRPASTAPQKLKLKGQAVVPPLELVENPDILATFAKAGPSRPRLVIGFAAETQEIEGHGEAKRVKKSCDWIVANDVSGDVMGGNHNAVTLISDGVNEVWSHTTKDIIAHKLAAKIADFFA